MAKVTPKTPHSDNPFAWRGADVELDLTRDLGGGAAGTYDVDLVTLQAGTIILEARIVCITPDTGATSTTIDLEMGAGGTVLLSGTADNLGAAYGQDASTLGEAGNSSSALASADVTVNGEITIVGTMTVAPTFQLLVLCGRSAY